MNLLCTKYCNLWFAADEGTQILRWWCAVWLSALKVCVCVCAWSHDYWPCGSQTPGWWAVIDYFDQIPAPLSCCLERSEKASVLQDACVCVELLHSSCWFWQTWAPRHRKTTAAFVAEYVVPPLRDGQRSVKPFFKMADTANACSPCLFQSVPPPPPWCANKNWFWRAEAYGSAMHAPLMLINNLRGWVQRTCVLTLGILKKLCIIQCVHWFIDFFIKLQMRKQAGSNGCTRVCVFVIYWVIYLE